MPRTLALAAALAALAPAASAQGSNCGPRDAVVSHLADRFGESRQSIGLAANNAVVEVFANLDTGTWTVTVTIAGGATCLLASGEAFQVLGESQPAGLPT